MKALEVYAGPLARQRLRECGLRAADVRVIPAAAGGPKGLVLLPLDRFLFGHWLADVQHTVHLLGASIGAWRMACACLPEADRKLAELAEDYITQSYPHAPGRMPEPATVSRVLGEHFDQRLGRRAAEVLASPRFRLHVFTSRGLRLLHRPGPVALPLGWLGAALANAAGRPLLGSWMERVVFSDPRAALPLPLVDYPTRRAPLTPANLSRAVLASCSIPFALQPVEDVPEGPAGTYWDGGITDYHLHLDYAALNGSAGAGWGGGAGLVLYPHFGPWVVPGWLDKAFTRRHRATSALDNLVLLAPSPEWVRSLPGGRLPDRTDFKRYAEDVPQRMRRWRSALSASGQLADELADLVAGGRPVDSRPLL